MVKEIRNGILFFDGCDTTALAAQYGTPLYIFSETEIVSRFSELRSCFLEKYYNTRVAYACKAFCTPAMLRLVMREGMCIDVVSGGELYTALRAGFPPERIEFNGNNKLPSELELAVDAGIGRIIIDGLQELPLLESICRKKGVRMNVLYRITPGVKASTHDYIVTGKKDSKFGIPLEDTVIYPAVEAAIRSEFVNFLGFHYHVGSQLFDNTPYLQALEVALGLVRETRKRFGFSVRELNIGGGYGIRYTGEERRPYSYFLDPVMTRLNQFCADEGIERPAVVIEPGRSIVGEAGITLYTVGSIKEIPGVRKYISVDGGMTDNIRPALYQAVYKGMLAGRADEPATEQVTVCGKCCESGDLLMRDVMLPPARSGDIFAVFSTGAYGYSMASNYNHNPIPAVILVKEGRPELIVRRQTYDDLLTCAVIPDSLK
ncbi:MAG: diaminopimelate decarboxylase [Intestinimonas sp.]|jgi:diaminopimelate decarboxylase|nr:diaminopimelate decarboxylase [Intestinimonas sp.]